MGGLESFSKMYYIIYVFILQMFYIAYVVCKNFIGHLKLKKIKSGED